jgi:D-tyrosyl-tRNA(Tyr) deacylase
VRAVVQRVSRAAVAVDGEIVGAIGRGLLILLGVAAGDGPGDAAIAADKISQLRIFPDSDRKMNRSLADVGGEVLLVSQFTLLADIRKGRRPSFTPAAPPEAARAIVDAVAVEFRRRGIAVATGEFGAMMQVELVNEGPVTIVVDVEAGRVQ